jgi:hypothetical protein
MSLTKVSYSMITGAPVNIFDYMTAAQIADVQSNAATIDVSTTIQSALTAFVAAGKFVDIIFPNGTYKLDSALTINVTYIAVDFNNSTLKFTSMTSGFALNIVGQPGVSPYTNGKVSICNGLLLGPGAASAVSGIRFYSSSAPTEAGPSHISLANIVTSGFSVGHTFGGDAYCIDLFNCDINTCNTGATQAASSSSLNAGERISYHGGTIFNNLITGIDMNNANGEFVFSQTSFDYNARQFYINGGRVNLINCHVENSTYAAEPIYIDSTNGGTFVMHGGWMVCTGSNTVSIVSVNTTASQGGGASFRDVFMNNLGSAAYFATGTGRCTVSNTFSFNTRQNPLLLSAAGNLLTDGGFEGTVVADAFISADTSAITSRVTGANIALTNSSTYARTGTKSLRAAKTFGGGSVASFVIMGALQDKSSASNRLLYYTKPGSETGSMIVAYGYANIQAEATTGLPFVYKSTLPAATTITFTSAAVDWTALRSGEPIIVAPPWATHSIISVNMIGFVGPGNIYFDDVEITVM